MPVIRVEMFKRTLEQKRELVKELTNSFVKRVNCVIIIL